MKTFLKILKISALVFISILVVLALVGWLMEDKIEKLALEKVSQNIHAPLGMESVSFSLIRDFPLATVQLNGFWMGAQQDPNLPAVDASIDTLVRLDKLFVMVESKPLLNNIFNIHEVELNDGLIRYLVDAQGASCFDFLLSTDSTAEEDTLSKAPLELVLDKLVLQNINCQYNDEQQKAKAHAFIPDLEGTANIDSSGISFTAKGGVVVSQLDMDSTNLYKMEQADVIFDVSYQLDTLLLESVTARTKEANINASGRLLLVDDLPSELEITATDLDIKELSKYIPSAILRENQISQLQGILNLEAKINGKLNGENLPHYEASFELSNGRAKMKSYPRINRVTLKGSATNGILNSNATTSINVERLDVASGKNKVNLKGYFQNLDQLHYYFNSNIDIDLASVRPFVPDTVIQNLNGNLKIKLATRGILPNTINDQFINSFLQSSTATIQMNNVDVALDSINAFSDLSGQLSYQNQVIDLENINVKYPKYELELINNSFTINLDKKATNLDAIQITFKEFHAKAAGSSLKGVGSVKNLNHPTFSIKADLDADLANAKQFVPDSLVKNMSGRLKASILSEGTLHLDSIADQIDDIIYDRTRVELELNNVGVNMPDSLMDVSRLTGRISVTPEIVTLNQLSGHYHGINFKVDTSVVTNLYSTALRNQPGKLEVKGVYRVDHIDYKQLMAIAGSGADNNEDQKASTNPAEEGQNNLKYQLKGKFFVNSLKYKKGTFRDISGLFNINSDSLYLIDSLKMQAFNGDINSAVRIYFSPDDEIRFFMRNKLENVDIRKLLFEMEDFDQKEMTYENISGTVTSEEIYTRLSFIGDSLVFPETRMVGDFLLKDGGIYNFEPVKMLESVPSIDRADTLLFETIDNHVFVFKDTICVPRTYVKSNKFDISIIGMQSFNMDFDYHLEFSFGQMVFGSSKKQQKKKDKIEDGGKAREKDYKWVQLLTENGNIRPPKIFPSKKERTIMTLAVKSRERVLNFRFNFDVSFETGVSEKLRSFH